MLTKSKSVGSMNHHEAEAGVLRKGTNQTQPLHHNTTHRPKKKQPPQMAGKRQPRGRSPAGRGHTRRRLRQSMKAVMTISRLLAAALKYAAHGWPVLPCGSDKKPLIKDWPNAASTDEKQIREWWSTYPTAMIGVVTGPRSGLFAIDVDVKYSAPGLSSLAALEREHGKLPDTLSQTTPSGGIHFLFEYPKDIKLGNSIGKLSKGIDTRGKGGYIIVAPSPGYRWRKVQR
jgi:hypothetical protein